MVELGLSNRSMSYTATFGEVSLSGYSRTICHEAPAGGFQKEPVVALVLLVRGGDGVVEAEPEEDPLVRPTPRPTPRAMPITRRTPTRMNQVRFLRKEKQLLDCVGSALDMSKVGYCLPG